jgi:hypothetical protein
MRNVPNNAVFKVFAAVHLKLLLPVLFSVSTLR